MLGILVLLILGTVAVYGLGRRAQPSAAERGKFNRRFALLLAAGLFAAAPFLTDHGLGTGEAYNYSLSTADFVTQVRAGVFPPLVGQSAFAFNGRIHPLRTAPYMDYLAALFDLLTLHRLNFWALQNLTIAASLIAAVFSFYVCVRRATEASAALAAALAAAYVLAPGVLAAAYAMDLYMTVMTLPWVPVILLAALGWRGGRRDSVLLAVGLAAIWTAHPPVAFWVTVVTALLLVPALWRERTRISSWLRLAEATVLAAVLSAFTFASALTAAPSGQLTGAENIAGQIGEVRRAFSASLLPISPSADQLGDFQLGYAYWMLLLLAAVIAIARRRPKAGWLVASALFLLAFTTPVPGVLPWLWSHLPDFAVQLTNTWPMQRLYLIITALVLFAFAAACRQVRFRPGTRARRVLGLGLLVAVGWTGLEALKFVERGFDHRQDARRSIQLHLPQNLDLTIVAYAMLGAPPSFNSGFMDPEFEFRLRRSFTATELEDDWSAPARAVAQGTFTAASHIDDTLYFEPHLTLDPGRRYRLDLAFDMQPTQGTLQLIGSRLYREYNLPSTGNSAGFGMLPGNLHALTLWTDGTKPEDVAVRLVAPGLPSDYRPNLADFTLREIDPAKLPIVLESLVPLRVRVTAPEDCYLETPRLYLPGYAATVNGRRVLVERSLDGLVIFAVPRGTSEIELTYPGPAILRIAFWLSFAGWLGVVLGVALDMSAATRRILAGLSDWVARRKGRLGAAVLAAAAVAVGIHFAREYCQAGPLEIRLLLPLGRSGRQEPVLVTGRYGAGTFVYLVYQDSTHVRVGLDVWGVLGYQSPPIATDYYQVQDMVISTGALYPDRAWAERGAPAATLAALRRRIRVELNGRTVIDREVPDYPAKPWQVVIGANRIDGSNCDPVFHGEILSVRRLPIPRDPAARSAKGPPN